MTALDPRLRSKLENAVKAARDVAEEAAREALDVIGLTDPTPPPGLSDVQRKLRRPLRAKARVLGQGSEGSGKRPLGEEIAYAQWHRMLFARILADNGLLLHPEGVAVSLADCAELAREAGKGDKWEIAAGYAAAMLPGIFRPEDPVSTIRLAPERRRRLEELIEGLAPETFLTDDALGWVYQFWQAKRKDEVNARGAKIGAAELPAVTQLFTEDYMVRFLLENSLGAWWAARHPDSPLIKEMIYLRTDPETGAPAAGTFPGWPERAADITMMDPCCGSAHFLVGGFHLLRKMRAEEEGLGEAEAADAVLRDNLHGLELDARCVQIAAFALALEAWKVGGHRPLPRLRLACSGLAVAGERKDWEELAKGDERLRGALGGLQALFADAPVLGSLIDPNTVGAAGPLLAAGHEDIAPLLERAIARYAPDDPVASVFGQDARRAAEAASLLAGKYTLVATNVPYLSRGSQVESLKDHLAKHHADAKADLATGFLDRCLSFCHADGTTTVVLPQNWLFLGGYKEFRKRLLVSSTVNALAVLGEKGFESSAAAGAFVVMVAVTRGYPSLDTVFAGLDVASGKTPTEKDLMLRELAVTEVEQLGQIKNPDSRISTSILHGGKLLAEFADTWQGIKTGDDPRFRRQFWELQEQSNVWSYFSTTVDDTQLYGGLDGVVLWQEGRGELRHSTGARVQGLAALGKRGICISQMRELPASNYMGSLFDSNVSPIVPKEPSHLAAIWAFCSSPEYHQAVRDIDTSLKVTNATLVKVSFDLDRWQKISEEQYPDGLPEPYSDDPTQWLFRGDVATSAAPLHVAIARLLGYLWPEQPEDALDDHADPDGIVCLPPLREELPAAERLRRLLAAAYGERWSPALSASLLTEAGATAGQDLAGWLSSGGFFKAHCRMFHNRPFVWHVHDGARDGFAALVNYHRLDGPLLDRLIYSYLNDWITAQQAGVASGVAGAEGRLVAARELQHKLQLIRTGAAPHDVYVRWKPLDQQPIGWEPDLDDGVRLNIRPFVQAGVLRAPFSVNWNKDRGANPSGSAAQRAAEAAQKAAVPNMGGAAAMTSCDGSERYNDLHLTIATKRAAREVRGPESGVRGTDG